MATTTSVGDSSSFKSDEDGGEMGHLSVSVSELNQLRQHVIAMRKNMTQKNRQNMAPAADNVSVLEEVDLTGSRANGAAGLVLAEENKTPEEKRRLFRLAVISNMFFMLGAILYICVAHGDLQWAKDVQGIPLDVLTADDDAAWKDFQKNRQTTATANPPHVRHARTLTGGGGGGGGMRNDQDQDFNGMMWGELPPDIQLALMVLGHNERTWDLGMTSSIEELPWNKMTKEQQDAAEIIGYTAEEWDEEEEEMEQLWEATQQAYYDTDADDGAPDDDRANDDAPEDDRVNDDRANDDAPDDDRANDDRAPDDDAPEDEDDRVNDDQAPEDDRVNDDAPQDDRVNDDAPQDDRVNDDAPQDDRVNDDAPEDDRVQDGDDRVNNDDRAADDDEPEDDAVDDQTDDGDVTAGEVFGWYKGQHDDYYPEGSTPPPTTTAPVPKYNVDGGEIAQSTPAAQAVVTRPPVVETTPPATNAASTTQTSIPNLENARSPADLMVWGKYDWEDIPLKYQKAFEILGYNEELWNTGGTALTEDLSWDNLTQAQQVQASILGYNEALWNEAQDGDYDSYTGRDVVPAANTETDPERANDGRDDDYPVVNANKVASDSSNDDEFMKIGDMDIETNAVLLFFAALSFLIVGIISWLRERQVFHIWMVQGGVWGILSALTMGFSSFASLLLQTVSVHCFLLESVFMLKLRATIRPVEGSERMTYALWGADVSYAIGAVIQVALVYVLHLDSDAYYDVGVGYAEVFAAWFWFIAAVIYSYHTMSVANKGIEEDSATRTLTIQRQHANGDTYTIRPAAIQLRNMANHPVVLT
ncbi:expressed unknown protein [Seminavis robusta]|uniref:Uncharacterized protein n=1 Tax=Seminavis robusta TaxID=568900 RepID=A0A9N8HVJ5_9STRA|nr:expressed unknown protein [Seminavis robusta]|eukprot:Sro2347_g324260.1 n/a (815) ;mRNA; r:6470-8914